MCIANRDVCIRAVFPNPTNASSLLEISSFWHSSQIAGLQPCKIGIASRSGNLWLLAWSLFPAAPPGSIRERPPVDGADTPPKLGTAYDIGPRQAIRDCNRVGLAKVAGGLQTGYDRTGNES
jgi:hypothetical protein